MVEKAVRLETDVESQPKITTRKLGGEYSVYLVQSVISFLLKTSIKLLKILRIYFNFKVTDSSCIKHNSQFPRLVIFDITHFKECLSSKLNVLHDYFKISVYSLVIFIFIT